jgi:hypothetical protein
MKLVKVIHTPAGSSKKLIAVFDNGKHISFGSKTSVTYAEGATAQKRDAYIKRHSVLENFNKIGPAALARFVLWEKPSISGGIAEFKRRFN